MNTKFKTPTVAKIIKNKTNLDFSTPNLKSNGKLILIIIFPTKNIIKRNNKSCSKFDFAKIAYTAITTNEITMPISIHK